MFVIALLVVLIVAKYSHKIAKDMADLNNAMILNQNILHDSIKSGDDAGGHGFKVRKVFLVEDGADENKSNVMALIASSDQIKDAQGNEACVIIFKGSAPEFAYDDLMHLRIDPQRVYFETNPKLESRIHSSFFLPVIQLVELGLLTYIHDSCSRELILLTGHSLGGAAADLVGMGLTHGLKSEGLKIEKFGSNPGAVQIYTFGEPHIYTFSRMDTLRQKFFSWFQRPVESCPDSQYVYRIYTSYPTAWYKKVDVISTLVSGRYFYHCARGYEINILTRQVTPGHVHSPFSSDWRPLWRSLHFHDFFLYHQSFNEISFSLDLAKARILDQIVHHPVALNDSAWIFVLLPISLMVLLFFSLANPSTVKDDEYELQERLLNLADEEECE